MLRPNVVVLKSLGKNFGLHGVRFGYLVANPALARRVREALPRWNLNALAEHVVFMLRDHQPAYRDSLRRLTIDRQEMSAHLATVPGLTVFPSQGNLLAGRRARAVLYGPGWAPPHPPHPLSSPGYWGG